MQIGEYGGRAGAIAGEASAASRQVPVSGAPDEGQCRPFRVARRGAGDQVARLFQAADCPHGKQGRKPWHDDRTGIAGERPCAGGGLLRGAGAARGPSLPRHHSGRRGRRRQGAGQPARPALLGAAARQDPPARHGDRPRGAAHRPPARQSRTASGASPVTRHRLRVVDPACRLAGRGAPAGEGDRRRAVRGATGLLRPHGGHRSAGLLGGCHDERRDRAAPGCTGDRGYRPCI